MKSLKKVIKIVLVPIMFIIAIVVMYPFIYALIAGFADSKLFQNSGGLIPITDNMNLISYKAFFKASAFRPFVNTIYRTAWFTGINTLMACLCGYVFARLEFTGKKFMFGIMIISQVIPGVLTMIPTFLLASKIPFFGGNNWLGLGGHGLIDNPLILYVLTGPGAFINVFLFRQSMLSLPVEYEEAASLDGCSFMKTIFTIILPMQKPIIAVIALNTAIGTWNDYMTPFIYINNSRYTTLPAYIGKLTSSLQQFGPRDLPGLFSLATIATIPVLALFLFFQSYIIQGIASTGIKE